MAQTDFRQNYHLMPQASMTLDLDLVFKNANQAYCRAVRRTRDQLVGRYVFEAFPDTADRVQPVMDAFQKSLTGEITRLHLVPYQLMLPNGQIEDRLWDIENQPLYSTNGDIIGLVQFCEDVTEREAFRKERDLVSAELMHRVRNTMAVVQSVAEHTGEMSDSIDEFLDGFSGRLMALSRNFTALSDANWQGLYLDDILQAELEPYLDAGSDRITIIGPRFRLGVKSTKDASMIFHELVTNASKHGFLTVPHGRVDVSWAFDKDHFKFTWRESGLTDLQPPARDGFGFQMMDMFPNIQLERQFHADGLKLSAEIPANLIASGLVFEHADG